ncbi:MAG: acyltransferase family protein [Syntrophothermus sp.]
MTEAPPSTARVSSLDHLKLLLVAAIIAAHGALAYGSLEGAWPYQEVQEVQLGAVSDLAVALVVIPAALFAMGLFFLVSGLLTPASVARKGPGRFARERLVRLGLPLALWTLAVWPATIWAAHLAAGEQRTFAWQLTHGDPVLDTGPMWFVAVLLIFSLVYAAWRGWRARRGDQAAPAGREPLSGWTLAGLAAGVSLATMAIRPVLPAASGQIGQIHL